MQFIEELRNYRPKSISFKESPLFISNFLPSLDEGEIELAIINLATTTGDVYSIRLKKESDHLLVNVLDEYQTLYVGFNNLYSQIPTQGELFDIITNMNSDDENQPFWLSMVKHNNFRTIPEIKEFIRINSKFYPNLNQLLEYYFVEHGYPKTDDAEKCKANTDNSLDKKEINLKMNEWQRLIGWLCFNIWHNTKHDFMESNNLRDMEIPFLCTFKIFQSWNNKPGLKSFKIFEIVHEIGPNAIDQFVIVGKDVIINSLPQVKEFIKDYRLRYGVVSSKAFATYFTIELTKAINFSNVQMTDLEFFQSGLQILLLLANDMEKVDPDLFNELLDIEEYEDLVNVIIEQISESI